MIASIMIASIRLFSGTTILTVLALAQPPPLAPTSKTTHASDKAYVLGPDDKVTIWGSDIEEISSKIFTIDQSGTVSLPMVGRIRAGGMTTEQFENEVVRILKTYLLEPQVAVSLTELGSRPVTVLGSVRNPGVVQLGTTKSLTEILSSAGGLREDAGPVLKLTRKMTFGVIPLPDISKDEAAEISVAQIRLHDLFSDPQYNIPVKPHDLITVTKSQSFFVLGEVTNPGAFDLKERESITVLEALSMAGGLNRTAAPAKIKVLRPSASGSADFNEVEVNLKNVISGKSPPIQVYANDVVYIGDSASKRAMRRFAEAALQAGTFMMSWGLIR